MNKEEMKKAQMVSPGGSHNLAVPTSNAKRNGKKSKINYV
jgi:hypothetical protein